MNIALVQNAHVANEEWRRRIGLAMRVRRVCTPVKAEEKTGVLEQLKNGEIHAD